MAGRGVIIINDDEEDALLSLSHAADSAGYALHQFDKEFVEELTTTAANDSSVSANEATLSGFHDITGARSEVKRPFTNRTKARTGLTPGSAQATCPSRNS